MNTWCFVVAWQYRVTGHLTEVEWEKRLKETWAKGIIPTWLPVLSLRHIEFLEQKSSQRGLFQFVIFYKLQDFHRVVCSLSKDQELTDKMKLQESGFQLPSFLPRLSYEKQDTLLKLLILSICAVLCKYHVIYKQSPILTREVDRGENRFQWSRTPSVRLWSCYEKLLLVS